MTYTPPPAGLSRCPHCGLATFSPAVLSQHIVADLRAVGLGDNGRHHVTRLTIEAAERLAELDRKVEYWQGVAQEAIEGSRESPSHGLRRLAEAMASGGFSEIDRRRHLRGIR
jgi:lipase chaperone LimK